MTKRPYTRVSTSRPRRSYVKGVPVSKIHQFENGDVKGAMKYPLIYHIVAGRDVQLRSNCMESARQMAGKYLSKNLGETGFFLKIRPFPHHVLR